MNCEPLRLAASDAGDGITLLSIDTAMVTVSPAVVHEEIGYGNRDADQYFTDVITDQLVHLPERMSVQAGFRVYALRDEDVHHDGIDIAGVRFDAGRTVMHDLQHPSLAAIFVCTIGSGPETYARELMTSGDVAESHLADTIASLAAERVASLVHGHIAAVMHDEGLGVSNRYSPGYCGWAVSEQQKLFSLLPGRCCGITLSPSSLMSPVKSVSGIIGIGKDVVWRQYGCATCGQKKCTYRTWRAERDARTVRL